MSEHPARRWSLEEIDRRIEAKARARLELYALAYRSHMRTAWCATGFAAGVLAGFLIGRFL